MGLAELRSPPGFRGNEPPLCPGAGSPLLTLLLRGLVSQGGSEKRVPFQRGMPTQGVPMPPAVTTLSPSPRTNQTSTITPGHWDRLERLSLPDSPPPDPPGSGCLSRPPALCPPEDAHGRTQQIGHTCGLGAEGPTPSQYLTLRFVVCVRPQAQTDGSSPS